MTRLSDLESNTRTPVENPPFTDPLTPESPAETAWDNEGGALNPALALSPRSAFAKPIPQV